MTCQAPRALLAAAIFAVSAACSGGTEPTTTTTSVEDAVREAHIRVVTEMFAFDSRFDGYEPFLTEARELTADPLLEPDRREFRRQGGSQRNHGWIRL